MRRGGAQALAPEVLLLQRDAQAERQASERVAQAALRYTPRVVLADTGTLLMDVGASLRLFGGPRALLALVLADVRGLGLHVRGAMAPTARGAGLLACHDAVPARRRALRATTLHRLLDALPATLLAEARPHADWLAGTGCDTLGALRRLPRAALQRRSGPALVQALDAAYGKQAEVHRGYVPPDHFFQRIDLVERLEHVEAVLAMAARLVAALCAWLGARRRAVSTLTLALEHERGRHARAPSVLPLALAEPAWRDAHLLGPLREHLARWHLPAPVTALSLATQALADAPDASATLFPEPGATPAQHRRLLDLLAARLGRERVRAPAACSDHRPEAANAWASALDAPPAPACGPFQERPFWLLPVPRPLAMQGDKPALDTPLRLLRGPERIESGWWDAAAARDYFVAEDERHVRYWIYRERDACQARWFLHGLFG